MSDNALEIPSSWVETTLAEFLSKRGATIDPSRYSSEFFELYSVPSFETGTPEKVKGADIGSSKQLVEPGQVLLCKINPRINRAWVVGPSQGLRQIASTEWIVFSPPDCISSDYIRYFLSKNDVKNFLATNVSGVGGSLMRVKASTIADFPLPIAPEKEQLRIVSKIDELLSRIEAGEEALRRAQTLVDRYRKSVLNAAVTGELTRNWRDKNRDKIEPADKLLERILKARRDAWEAAELAKMKAKGKPPKDDNWKKRYAEPAPPDTSELPELPEGWTWANWNTVGYSQNGRPFPSSAYQEQGEKLLRPGNLYADGRVKWNGKNTRCLPASYSEDNLDLLVGPRELVINLTAQSLKDEFLGRVCITGEGERCLLNQRLARLTPIIIPPEFMLLIFKSSLFRDFVSELNTGSLIQHMFTSQMGDFAFPVPPVEEQWQIVQRSSTLIDNAADLESCIGSQRDNTTKLSQGVLRAAFEGKLVHQDGTEEPASALLDRIRHTEQPSPSRRARKSR